MQLQQSQHTALALVGMGCRFPGQVASAEAFWDLLVGGADAVKEASGERWDLHRYYHADPTHAGTMYTRSVALLEQIDQFDAAFFGISPLEAASMDPQQRLLLEVTWEALEDAGIVPRTLAGSATGVFVGVCSGDYFGHAVQDQTLIGPYTMGGGSMSIVANRLSYFFDLHGPGLSVDTACSSSLVALHLACESLRKGECSLALVGGANLLLNPRVSVGFSKALMLSPQGHCFTFDARADGYVRGEGVGVVVLKPLARALEEHDTIYAVIQGTGVNQDGRTPGLHHPDGHAQAKLMRQVYSQAEIAPGSVQYVEAHGTGTPIGDPIECQALGEVLGTDASRTQPLLVGSVKSTLGHLEGASGIAGLIKAALVLQHRQVPANLHFQTPNPRIPFASLALKVPQTLEDLPATGLLTVGINSFGFGGTNAHAVLQSLPEPLATADETSSCPAEPLLFPLSARSPEALRALAEAYLVLLRGSSVPALVDLCFTLSCRREQHAYRLAAVVRSHAELATGLEAWLQGFTPSGFSYSQNGREAGRTVFVFSGNGCQWWAMGRELLLHNVLFRSVVERCDRQLRPLTGWSLLERLLAAEDESFMDLTSVAQPALFALQIALVALWKSYGIEPQAVLGHSIGEIAAAFAAGILSFEDAITLVFQRSRLQEQTAGLGRMLAVDLSEQEALVIVAPYGDRVSLASLNAPGSVTLSGEVQALEEIAQALQKQEVFCRFLRLNYAFHHQAMDPLHAELLCSLRELRPQPGRIPCISTVTGAELAGPAWDAEYWWQNVRAPVQFAPAIQQLLADGYTTFLEIGPHPVLSGYIVDALDGRAGSVLPSLRRKTDERAALLGTLGTLYAHGQEVRWEVLAKSEKTVRLPAYPWQRQRYWLEPPFPHSQSRPVHPLLGYRLHTAQALWENALDRYDLLYLRDHRIGGVSLFPAIGYLSIFLAAASDVLGPGAYEVEHLTIQAPLFLDDNGVKQIQTSYLPEERTMRVSGNRPDGWMTYASGQIRPWQPTRPAPVDLDPVQRLGQLKTDRRDIYQGCEQAGFQYGPAFRLIEQITLSLETREGFGRIQQPALSEQELAEHTMHPALLDCCIQVLLLLFYALEKRAGTFLPVEIAHIRCYTQVLPATPLYCYSRQTKRLARQVIGDCIIMDEYGNTLLEILGLRIQQAASSREEARVSLQSALYRDAWVPAPLETLQGALPAPGSVLPVLQTFLEQMHQRTFSHLAENPLPVRDQLCLAYVVRALRQLGWAFAVGERVTVESLRAHLGIVKQFAPLLTAWCLMLTEEGFLSTAADGWMVRQPLVEADVQGPLLRLLTRFPEIHPTVRQLMRSGEKLASLLDGSLRPLAVLCPEEDFTTLEFFYSNETLLQQNNALLQKAVLHVLEQLPADRVIRVLEIGAGTGGTTSYLLPILPADRTTYVFTDISQAFLQRARQNYGDLPFVSYQLLDIGQDPAAQGFQGQDFDLIIASNVLHATASIRQSLAHVRWLLRSEGWLGLVESTDVCSRLHPLVFGLLDGYWSFQDHELRPFSPLLSAATWQQVLTEEGFGEVIALSTPYKVKQPEMTFFLAQGPVLARPALTPTLPQEAWLVFADHQGLAPQLAALLAPGQVILLEQGPCYQQLAADHFQLAPDSEQDMVTLFASLRAAGRHYGHLLYLWGLDAAATIRSADDLQALVDTSCVNLLNLVREQLRTPMPRQPRLWIVAAGAQLETASALAQIPLAGLGRVIANEYPDLRCTVVDLGGGYEPMEAHAHSAAQALCRELLAQSEESEILLRGPARFVNRVLPDSLESQMRTDVVLAHPEASFLVKTQAPSTLDTLRLQAVPRIAPRSGEVEIAVAAVGLNFKDVAFALGMIPADEGEGTDGEYAQGLECTGKIVRVGEGVTHFQPGDEVIALGSNSMGAFHTMHALGVVHRPATLSTEEAASVIHVFLTAYYSLHELAHIARGERVLIHSATGGVGLAAIQIVQEAGGEIFATAGSAEKRAYLRSLGIQHVFDSRSLRFADEILQLTEGQGVDIVLNSLAGEAAEKSLELLRRFGRFLELGKRHFFARQKLDLQAFQRSLTYFSLDISQLASYDPERVQRLLHLLGERFAQQVYRPLPYLAFPLARFKDAFRYMQQSRHIGKLVLLIEQQYAPVTVRPVAQPLTLRADASYLITGGLSGFGLETARWLAAHGARSLVLASRSGSSTPEHLASIESLRATGVRVLLSATDVTQEAAVGALIEEIQQTLPPLRGIIHAAMVIDDHLVDQLHAPAWERVLAPKMLGAWHLHTQTVRLPLDFFVLYSSASSLLGNKGQGNYVASNLFLHAFARYRHALHLPALAVGWGPLAKVGYASQHAAPHEHLLRIGLTPLDPAPALHMLGQLLQEQRVQAFVSLINWSKLDTAWPDSWARKRWLFFLSQEQETRPEELERPSQTIHALLPEEREAYLLRYFQQMLTRVLGSVGTELDLSVSLPDLGLDSLMAMELRNRVKQDLEVEISVMQLLRPQRLRELIVWIAEHLEAQPTSEVVPSS